MSGRRAGNDNRLRTNRKCLDFSRARAYRNGAHFGRWSERKVNVATTASIAWWRGGRIYATSTADSGEPGEYGLQVLRTIRSMQPVELMRALKAIEVFDDESEQTLEQIDKYRHILGNPISPTDYSEDPTEFLIDLDVALDGDLALMMKEKVAVVGFGVDVSDWQYELNFDTNVLSVGRSSRILQFNLDGLPDDAEFLTGVDDWF